MENISHIPEPSQARVGSCLQPEAATWFSA